MKTFGILFLCFFVNPVFTAAEPGLIVEVFPTTIDTKLGETSFSVTAFIKNPSAEDKSFEEYSCSYLEDWETDQDFIAHASTQCFRNGLRTIIIKPQEIIERKISLVLTREVAAGEHQFRLIFKYRNNKIFSNLLTLKVSDAGQTPGNKVAEIDVKTRCQDEANYKCVGTCFDGWSTECYYVHDNVDKNMNLAGQEDKCYAFRDMGVCNPCRNIYRIEGKDVTCEEFYHSINEKNTTCNGCLKMLFSAGG